MIILSIIALGLGAALIILGLAARKGNQLLIKFDVEKVDDAESLQHYVGKNIAMLGFIGIIAGLAGIAMNEDNILVFIAYCGFALFFLHLIKTSVKTFMTKN